MKKIYSLVLMATALLVSTNMWATVRLAGNANELKDAWENAESGDEIKLTASFSIGTTLWLGTQTMDDDEPLSITLNLNGDTLTSTAVKVFVLTHGSLNVTGNGGIKHAPTGTIYSGGEYLSAFEIFRVHGSTYKDIDAKTSKTYYTHLTIGAGVKLIAAVNGIVVDQFSALSSTKYPQWALADAWAAGGKTSPSTAAVYTDVYKNGKGVAHGVCIDVKGTIEARKYAIKANGNLCTPTMYSTKIGQESNRATQYSDRSSTRYVIAADDEKNYSPYIHIYNGAKLLTTEITRTDAVAAYGGGYARWFVEGAVEGSTAVYVKSGEIELKNAQITSNFEGTASGSTADRTSGVDAGGSGLVIESSANYAGGTDVTVSGNTVITPTSGYAMEEKITNVTTTSKVDSIKIQGGTFHAGEAGTIVVTQVTANNETTSVAITGGTVEGGNSGTTIGNKNLSDFLQGQTQSTHATTVDVDDQGNETIVISNGAAPVVANSVIGAAENASINWQNTGTTEETLVADLKLTELQISQDYAQKLIIPDGKTLEVGRVVMGAKAQIVVKAGGKLVVTGAQGLAAFQESNLVLETQEGKPAIFLFNPAVTSNTHPMATVEFISKSYTNSSSDYCYQRFGIPTIGQLTNITAKNSATQDEVETAFISWINYAWTNIGFIHSSKAALDYSKMATPFEYYQMQHNAPYSATSHTVVTMKGQLVGNENPALAIKGNDWSTLANSFTAPIDGETLINAIPNTVDKAFYLYDINAEQATWESHTLIDVADQGIMPMQPFLIRNTMEAADVTVDYQAAVYDPIMSNSANNAPARRAAMDMTKAKMIVKGEGCIDRVTVAESDEFSAAFDNGYDAAKYMNDGINMYVSADEKMSIFATDNLENTYVGFQTVKGGTYTIEFAKVQGEELTLIDLETGARVAMVEGNVYEFTADANSVNDYRFEIVATAKVPTAVENTEAVKSVKGVYTITGQYVGEMNVWNTLPAGVYVVNGEKRVK